MPDKKQPMKPETAWSLVKEYEAKVKIFGQEWTDKHFLAWGTSRYERNKAALDEAYETIGKQRETES